MINDPIINFLFSFKTGKESKSVINNAIINNVTNVKQTVFIYYIYYNIMRTNRVVRKSKMRLINRRNKVNRKTKKGTQKKTKKRNIKRTNKKTKRKSLNGGMLLKGSPPARGLGLQVQLEGERNEEKAALKAARKAAKKAKKEQAKAKKEQAKAKKKQAKADKKRWEEEAEALAEHRKMKKAALAEADREKAKKARKKAKDSVEGGEEQPNPLTLEESDELSSTETSEIGSPTTVSEIGPQGIVMWNPLAQGS